MKVLLDSEAVKAVIDALLYDCTDPIDAEIAVKILAEIERQESEE